MFCWVVISCSVFQQRKNSLDSSPNIHKFNFVEQLYTVFNSLLYLGLIIMFPDPQMVAHLLRHSILGHRTPRLPHHPPPAAPPHPPRRAPRDLLLHHHRLAQLPAGEAAVLALPRVPHRGRVQLQAALR